MGKIFKYVIEPEGTTITEGQVARLLTTAWQGDDLCVWAEIEDRPHRLDAPHGLHVIPVPTGQNVPIGYHYLGTAHPNVGSPDLFGVGIVMHVYSSRLRNR